jgi:hypothetical protein
MQQLTFSVAPKVSVAPKECMCALDLLPPPRPICLLLEARARRFVVDRVQA